MRISKRTGLALAILGLTVVPFAWVGLAPAKTTAPSSKQVGCGIERWSVKTLADPAGRTLSLSPKATTIRALRNRTVPGYLGLRRSRGVERTTFRVRAKLVEMKLEDDSDIHLVIADPTRTGATLIAEFPLASCTARRDAEGSTQDAPRAKRADRRVRLAVELVQEAQRHGDDLGRRLLRPDPRPDGRRPERHRAPSGRELQRPLRATKSRLLKVRTRSQQAGPYQGATVVPPHSSGSTSRTVWLSSQR